DHGEADETGDEVEFGPAQRGGNQNVGLGGDDARDDRGRGEADPDAGESAQEDERGGVGPDDREDEAGRSAEGAEKGEATGEETGEDDQSGQNAGGDEDLRHDRHDAHH